MSITASRLVQRSLPAGGRCVDNRGRVILDVRLVRRIHAGLTITVALPLEAEIGVLYGPSGSGKTSILRMITGVTRPDTGLIRLGNCVLFDSGRRINLPLRRRRIGMIFPGRSALPTP